MTNKQQHGNREAKKPKKAKSKTAPVVQTSVWASGENAHPGAPAKK
jgi:hypothetical protein